MSLSKLNNVVEKVLALAEADILSTGITKVVYDNVNLGEKYELPIARWSIIGAGSSATLGRVKQRRQFLTIILSIHLDTGVGTNIGYDAADAAANVLRDYDSIDDGVRFYANSEPQIGSSVVDGKYTLTLTTDCIASWKE